MRSLQLRFLLAMVAGAVLFALFAAVLAYQLGFNNALTSGRASLEGLIHAVEKTAAIGAYTGDKVLLQELIDGLARNPLSAYVEVRDVKNVLLVSQSDHDIDPAGGGAGNPEDAADGVIIEHPLKSPFDQKEVIGVLKIKANMAKLQAAARSDAVCLAVLMTAQTVAVALLLYMLAARFVSQPIVAMASALRKMTPGTGARLVMPPLHRHDEIGVLIGGANALLDANEVALLRERELRESIEKMEAQYRQIFDASSAGIFVLGADGHLINSNPTALKIMGLSLSEFHPLQAEDFVQRIFARPDQVQEMIRDAARRKETVSADLDLCLLGAAAPRWVHCLISVQGKLNGRVSDAAGDTFSEGTDDIGMIEGVMYDITERKHAETAVQHRAEHDSLTGLKNRSASDALLDRFLRDAAIATVPVSVLYIDVDGFKKVNDEFGHKAGDQVLIKCARRIRSAVRRNSDLIARVGGDEFLVALYGVGPGEDSLTQAVQGILSGLCKTMVLEDRQIASIGASIGIACYPRHGLTRKEILHAADAVMYEVKRTGKNSFAVASQSLMIS